MYHPWAQRNHSDCGTVHHPWAQRLHSDCDTVYHPWAQRIHSGCDTVYYPWVQRIHLKCDTVRLPWVISEGLIQTVYHGSSLSWKDLPRLWHCLSYLSPKDSLRLWHCVSSPGPMDSLRLWYCASSLGPIALLRLWHCYIIPSPNDSLRLYTVYHPRALIHSDCALCITPVSEGLTQVVTLSIIPGPKVYYPCTQRIHLDCTLCIIPCPKDSHRLWHCVSSLSPDVSCSLVPRSLSSLANGEAACIPNVPLWSCWGAISCQLVIFENQPWAIDHKPYLWTLAKSSQ